MTSWDSSVKAASVEPFRELDLSTRLRANLYPCASDRHNIEALTREAREELSRIDEEIQAIQAKRQRVATYLARCESLCAPIRKLSNALLSAIFALCASSTYISDHDREEACVLPGVSLGLVCSPWRAVTLQTPNLWSHLRLYAGIGIHDELEEPYSAPVICQRMQNLVQLHLDRSGDALLDVCVTKLNLEVVEENPALSLLFSQSHRWRSFRLQAWCNIGGDFLEELQGRLPLLESVAMETTEDVRIGFLPVFNTAPKLNFWHFQCSDEDQEPAIPLMVPSVSLVHASSSVFLRLPSYEHLRSVRLEIWDFRDRLDSQTSILLPTIQSLELTPSTDAEPDDHLGVIDRILNSVQVPNLKHLSLEDHSFDDICTFPAIKHFFLRSNAALASLELRGVPMTHSMFLELLQLMPSLRTLILEDVYVDRFRLLDPSTFVITADVIRALRSTKQLLPRLEHITIEAGCVELSDDQIAEMVVLRAESGLKTFRLTMQGRDFCAEAYERWRDLHYPQFHAEVTWPKSTSGPGHDFCSCTHGLSHSD